MRTFLLLICLAIQPVAFADKYAGTLDVFEADPALQPFFKNAFGYAVFPTVGKGGIGIGGAYGKGQLYRQGQLVGTVKMSELSLGFQLGGQAFSEIIFLQDQRAFDEFTSGRFEFDATASAVAITASANAQAGTAGASASTATGPSTTRQVEYGYNKGMAVFIHSLGGLMYEASIGGQKFSYEALEPPEEAI